MRFIRVGSSAPDNDNKIATMTIACMGSAKTIVAITAPIGPDSGANKDTRPTGMVCIA